jgi:hypothetical protein
VILNLLCCRVLKWWQDMVGDQVPIEGVHSFEGFIIIILLLLLFIVTYIFL